MWIGGYGNNRRIEKSTVFGRFHSSPAALYLVYADTSVYIYMALDVIELFSINRRELWDVVRLNRLFRCLIYYPNSLAYNRLYRFLD